MFAPLTRRSPSLLLATASLALCDNNCFLFCAADQPEPHVPRDRGHLCRTVSLAQPLHLRGPKHCHHHPPKLLHHLPQQPGAVLLRQRAVHELWGGCVLRAPHNVAVHQLLPDQLHLVCLILPHSPRIRSVGRPDPFSLIPVACNNAVPPVLRPNAQCSSIV